VDYREVKTVPVDAAHWELITDGMADVTTSGTAAAAHLQGIDFAGKTGTAQVISLDARKRLGSAGKRFEDNSWFVGMAPRRNPDIVVAVLSEGAGWGWKSALVASKIIKAYEDKKYHPEMHYAQRSHTTPTPVQRTPASDEQSSAKTELGATAPDDPNRIVQR
jgi:penicillin-binding protein 2